MPTFLPYRGAVILLTILLGCFRSLIAQPPQALIIDEAERIWQVAIAADTPSRNRGLMHRPWLAPWQGMLFLFPRPNDTSFWMKNTITALDIRFYDDQGALLARYPHAQPCLHQPCPTYPSFGKALYVLETRSNSWIGEHIRILSLPEHLEPR